MRHGSQRATPYNLEKPASHAHYPFMKRKTFTRRRLLGATTAALFLPAHAIRADVRPGGAGADSAVEMLDSAAFNTNRHPGSAPRRAVDNAKESSLFELAFYHLHTGERLEAPFARDDALVTEGWAAINHLLRDFRTGDVHPIDPEVLFILHAARAALNPNGVFEVISGYRSPKTNEMLRAGTSGVAKKSFHMQGRAVDVRLQGVRTDALRAFCRKLGRGGVGYYAKSDFVHLDNGGVRSW